MIRAGKDEIREMHNLNQGITTVRSLLLHGDGSGCDQCPSQLIRYWSTIWIQRIAVWNDWIGVSVSGRSGFLGDPGMYLT